jgi:hypothetical protein
MNLAEKIKNVCFDGKRFSPKRNLNWLKTNYPDIASEIEKLFGDKYPVSFVYKLLNNGINSLDEVPLCQVCRQNKISLSRNKIHDVCSVRCSAKKSAEKATQTCIERYGKKRNFGDRKQSYELGEHHLHRNIKNLHLIDNDDFMIKLQSRCNWRLVARIFGLTSNSHSSSYRFMNKIGYPMQSLNGKSNIETDVFKFVSSLDDTVIRNTKSIITPYELDIYSEKHKIAIEFDGLYYHSSGEKCTDEYNKKRHLDKTERCERQNIHLFHIFENEWVDETKREIWKSKLRIAFNKVVRRIYARKCIKQKISYLDAKNFCVNNHLQGFCESGKIFEGLFYENELVMVIVLGKSRYNKQYDYELLRMCSSLNTIVIGGASKLLKNYNFISYGNRRWCNVKNNVYSKFAKCIGSSGPCYWYVDKGSVYHRSKFMKHKLTKLFDNFDNLKTEVENCYNNGLRRIWDCGNLIFVKDEE